MPDLDKLHKPNILQYLAEENRRLRDGIQKIFDWNRAHLHDKGENVIDEEIAKELMFALSGIKVEG